MTERQKDGKYSQIIKSVESSIIGMDKGFNSADVSHGHLLLHFTIGVKEFAFHIKPKYNYRRGSDDRTLRSIEVSELNALITSSKNDLTRQLIVYLYGTVIANVQELSKVFEQAYNELKELEGA